MQTLPEFQRLSLERGLRVPASPRREASLYTCPRFLPGALFQPNSNAKRYSLGAAVSGSGGNPWSSRNPDGRISGRINLSPPSPVPGPRRRHGRRRQHCSARNPSRRHRSAATAPSAPPAARSLGQNSGTVRRCGRDRGAGRHAVNDGTGRIVRGGSVPRPYHRDKATKKTRGSAAGAVTLPPLGLPPAPLYLRARMEPWPDG